MNLIDRFLMWLNPPPATERCKHPEYARDYRVRLWAEQDAWEAYEVCLICGKEME